MTDPIRSVAIIGAGTMGRRISFGCVIHEVPTRLFDIDSGALEEAMAVVRALIEERESDGQLPAGSTDAGMSCLEAAPSLEAAVAGVDLAIETVHENVELKRKVFADIDRIADLRTLFGSNTSSIPASWLATSTGRPEKVFNFNWGTPDDPKVEVMGHPDTDKATLDAVDDFLRRLDLVPIHVPKEILGYASNRVWRAVKKEVLFLIAGGYATAEDLDRGWMLDHGTKLGPCALMDLIGLDVVRDIENVYYEASGDPSDKPPEFLEEMIANGKLGVKTGEGFYSYPDPAFERPNFLKGIE